MLAARFCSLEQAGTLFDTRLQVCVGPCSVLKAWGCSVHGGGGSGRASTSG